MQPKLETKKNRAAPCLVILRVAVEALDKGQNLSEPSGENSPGFQGSCKE